MTFKKINIAFDYAFSCLLVFEISSQSIPELFKEVCDMPGYWIKISINIHITSNEYNLNNAYIY